MCVFLKLENSKPQLFRIDFTLLPLRSFSLALFLCLWERVWFCPSSGSRDACIEGSCVICCWVVKQFLLVQCDCSIDPRLRICCSQLCGGSEREQKRQRQRARSSCLQAAVSLPGTRGCLSSVQLCREASRNRTGLVRLILALSPCSSPLCCSQPTQPSISEEKEQREGDRRQIGSEIEMAGDPSCHVLQTVTHNLLSHRPQKTEEFQTLPPTHGKQSGSLI